MAQGIGNAQKWLVIGVTLLFLSDIAQAATYAVGDKGGWSFNLVNWPKGKSFKAGDLTAMAQWLHHSKGIQGLSGNDNIKLFKGHNYFICNIVGHCQAGMKIAINAV
ncbi:basic blue-like protein [Cinnamomum micranthum f. kanehirae]|uniref:Basic blue-like protein n=1 Tax=Cinnamomum micranthum f. kanehirae TaxID=337451 RepID=A0A3S3MEL7_9MAGN|nr:basic blue-like protein [Cinnamomum micranthum f. kanehirae]